MAHSASAMHFQLDALINDSMRDESGRGIRVYLIVPTCKTNRNSTNANATQQIMDVWLCSAVIGLLVTVCVVSSLGMVGNVMIIHKFRRRSRSNFGMHVQCLAATDMINLLIMVADASVHFLEACSSTVCQSAAIQIAYWHVVIWYLGNVVATSRHYQTLYFAIDRYLAVRRPMHFLLDSKCEKKNVVANVVAISVVSAVINVPQSFKLQTLICEDTHTIMSITTRLPYLRLYTTIVSLVVQLLVPLFGSVVTSVMLVIAFRRQLRELHAVFEFGMQPTPSPVTTSGRYSDSPNMVSFATKKSGDQRRGTVRSLQEHTMHGVMQTRRLNRSLLIFVSIFVVCEMPVLIYFYVSFTVLNTPARQLVVSFAFALSAIDSSVNFLAYSAADRNFRSRVSLSNRVQSTRLNSVDVRRPSRLAI